jgi:hypothetical protein
MVFSMANAYESWLEKGWSPWRRGIAIVGALGAVFTAVQYIRERHHPGGIWYLVSLLAVLVVWLGTEVLRWRIKHQRMEVKINGLSTDVANIKGDIATIREIIEGIRTTVATLQPVMPQLHFHDGSNPTVMLGGGGSPQPQVAVTEVPPSSPLLETGDIQ